MVGLVVGQAFGDFRWPAATLFCPLSPATTQHAQSSVPSHFMNFVLYLVPEIRHDDDDGIDWNRKGRILARSRYREERWKLGRGFFGFLRKKKKESNFYLNQPSSICSRKFRFRTVHPSGIPCCIYGQLLNILYGSIHSQPMQQQTIVHTHFTRLLLPTIGKTFNDKIRW